MIPWLALASSTVVAAGMAVWWYGRREEKVRGRALAAFLRGAALLLVLSAPWLPGLAHPDRTRPPVGILLDRSASMSQPAAGPFESRWQAALQAVRELSGPPSPVRIFTFADDQVREVGEGDLETILPAGPASRVSSAIELARAEGADSLILITDGELADREAARRLAERVGIAMREIRVPPVPGRTGIRVLSAPHTVTAGDTFEVRAEIVSASGAGDSAEVRLDFGTGVSSTLTVELPAAGRATEAVFRVPAESFGDSIIWRPLDVQVDGRDPPRDAAARSRIWVEVTPDRSGAVMISVDPDWEPRALLPVLERTVPGGARAFLYLGDGAWVRVGRPPSGGVTADRVSRVASSANLLVVQGDPSKLPPWLQSAVRQRPALLFLVRGTGDVPGTEVGVREVLPGQWYAEAPPPPGPVSADLIGVDPVDLPPLTRLFGSPNAAGPVLLALRDRRGASRPVAATGSSGERRWAVVYGEGTWRWAARGGAGLSLYRGLYSGMVRWLVARSAARPVELSEPYVRAGDSLRWRAAPGVSDLSIQVRDSAGMEVWSRSATGPTSSLAGPPIGSVEARFVATGRLRGVPFRIERPFHANPGVEELPGPSGPPLDVGADNAGDGRTAASSGTPVWPFGAAIVLLCAEWLWRRRMGLR